MRSVVGRGLLAGVLGTAAMVACETAHAWLRRGAEGPIDYDISEHVPLAAARVLRVPLRTEGESWLLFVVTQGGYGSAFGVIAALLDQAGLPPWQQGAVFFGLTQTMALSLFPTLGETPPPWRWRAEPLVTSVLQHAVYAAAVVTVQRRLRPLK